MHRKRAVRLPQPREAVRFHIEKAPLCIRAKDKTITYGETLSDNGAEINGFVNNENETVLSGLNYAFDYAQFSDIGTYTIIPMDAQAENYKITYENGVLTVQPKPVEIKWNSESLFYYDGTPKLVTAEAIGAVNGDALTAIIEDGSRTEIGEIHRTRGRSGRRKGGQLCAAPGANLLVSD